MVLFIFDSGDIWRSVVAHATTNMAVVESRANSFSGLIGWVDNAWNIRHCDESPSAPVLESKVLDIAVSCTFGGNFFVHHV